MFIREKKCKGKEKAYLQIVENERIGKKVKQKVILSLGCLDALKKSGQLRKLANSLLKYCESDFCDIEKIQEERRLHWGIPKLIERLWSLFDFEGILKECSKDRVLQFDFQSAIKLMLADRFIGPCSKLKSYERQNQYESIEEVPLHHLYKALDCLAEFKDQIEQKLFEKNRTLFNMHVDVVFYDVTILYFESEKTDELRNYGFSKDNKCNEVQVVLGLLVDMEGRPLGYDIFPGNMYEGHTLATAIEKLKKQFNIQRLIFVADQGMIAGANLEIIRNSGYEYIISCRLKKLEKKLQEQVLDLASYADMPRENASGIAEEEPDINKYKIIIPENIFGALLSALQNQGNPQEVYRSIRNITKHVPDAHLKKVLRAFRKEAFTSDACKQLIQEIKNYLVQRLIITWSQKRAARDKAKRDILVDKAQVLANGPAQSLSQRGPRRYLKLTAQEIALNQDRIDQEAQWDGFYGICTNAPNIHWKAVLEHYHNLWRIEESFRIFKSHLETRPIFHWTAKRIEGHLVLCFIAFLFERTIELKQRHIDYSPDKIREAINTMQLSLLEINNQKFHLCANINSLAREILKIFHIKIPPKIAPVQDLTMK